MSTIFLRKKPRHDATIRVKCYALGGIEETDEYVQVELLEFHPDVDKHAKFRGYAYVRPHPDLLYSHMYRMCGEGYLEQPYMCINEVFIHRSDVDEMMTYCRKHQFRPLIIHKCPLPFPVFEKGTKVSVIDDPENEGRFAGRTGSIVTSSTGGKSSVIFDDGVRWHFNSICLRAETSSSHPDIFLGQFKLANLRVPKSLFHAQ